MENHKEKDRYQYAYSRVKQIIDEAEVPIREDLVDNVYIACMEEEDLEEVAILLMIEKGLPEDMFDYCIGKAMCRWWGKSHIVNLLDRMKQENLFEKLLDRTYSFFGGRSFAQRYQSLPEEVVLFTAQTVRRDRKDWIYYTIDRGKAEYSAFDEDLPGPRYRVYQTTVNRSDILYILDDSYIINPEGRDIRLTAFLPTEYYFKYAKVMLGEPVPENMAKRASLERLEKSIYDDMVKRAKNAGVSTEGTISEIVDRIICKDPYF